MKVKLYKVHNISKNKWVSFKNISMLNKYLEHPLNVLNDIKVYVEYEPEVICEQLKFDLEKLFKNGEN